MTLTKQIFAALFACCIAGTSFAASTMDIPGKPLSGLSSNAVVINNWESLKQELIAAYGGTVLEAKSAAEMGKLNNDPSPKAYTADLGQIQMFAIEKQAVPDGMHSKLLEIFDDLKVEDFEEYTHGMSIIVSKAGGSDYSARLILLKDIDVSEQTSGLGSGEAFVLDSKTTLKLPAGTEILTQNEKTDGDLKVEIYRMQISTSSRGFRDYVTGNLDESDISYKEQKIGPMTSLIIETDVSRAQLSFETDAAASDTSTVSLTIYRYN